MADNFVANAGADGKTFVTAQGSWSGDTADLPGQFGIIASGSEGSWTFNVIAGGAGAVSAGTTRVTLASDDPAVVDLAAMEVLLGAIDADTDAIKTAVQLIDNAISGAGFNITQLGGAAVPIGAGTEAAAVRVTLANNSTGVVSVDNDGTFAVQAVCTNAGTFAVQSTLAAETTKVIGTVNIAAAQTLATVTTVGAVTAITNALPAGDNNVGNVDIVTLPSGNLGMQAMAASLSVVPANNITDATYIGDIKFGEALPAGTNAIGKLAANSGVDIGDVDVTSIAAGTNTIGGVIAQTSTSAAYDGTTSCTIKRISGVAADSGANTIVAAVADKKIRVLALSLIATSTTAVVAYVYNGDYMLLGNSTNKLTLDMDGVGGPAGLVLPWNQGGWFQTDTANEALAINLGGATPVVWCVTYIEVA
jgi:hypothetical protein